MQEKYMRRGNWLSRWAKCRFEVDLHELALPRIDQPGEESQVLTKICGRKCMIHPQSHARARSDEPRNRKKPGTYDGRLSIPRRPIHLGHWSEIKGNIFNRGGVRICWTP